MPHSFIKNVKRTQKNDTFFYKERKRTKRTQRSFIKNIKERKECSILFIKTAKERDNVSFFWKERKRTLRSFEKNVCPTLIFTPVPIWTPFFYCWSIFENGFDFAAIYPNYFIEWKSAVFFLVIEEASWESLSRLF